MAQRLFTFLVLSCLLASGAKAAEGHGGPPAAPRTTIAPQKSIQENFLDGIACLEKSDTPCAQAALANISPSSPYAKILEAKLSAAQQDFDTVLRLLIPLQAEKGLLPSANASLHATLALAYDNRNNPLRALEQRCQTELYLAEKTEVEANQMQIWQSLTTVPKESLLEMRGDSPDAVVQGWIDLALVAKHFDQGGRDIEQWRKTYGEHPASDKLLQMLANETSTKVFPPIEENVALLLPLETPGFAVAAEAVQAGFMAAADVAHAHPRVQIYPTRGDRDQIALTYRRAIEEGASYVAGPLTREEVATLNSSKLITVPTLALNALQEGVAPADKIILFGLPVEEESRQLASIVRAQGIQSVIVAVADSALARRMAQAFAAEWTGLEGATVLQIEFSADSNMAELKAQITEHPADMIFLAANAEQARAVRPYLDQAIPTYGLSHIYDGNPENTLNSALSAIHFVDMPWLLESANPEYSEYRHAASALPPGEAQRWFAVGVDAWHILSAQAGGTIDTLALRGLSGKLSMQGNRIVRKLTMAQFRSNGILIERTP
jgi:uncharacterized protein